MLHAPQCVTKQLVSIAEHSTAARIVHSFGGSVQAGVSEACTIIGIQTFVFRFNLTQSITIYLFICNHQEL